MIKYMQTMIPRFATNSSRSIQMPMSLIIDGSFFYLYSHMPFNSIAIRRFPAQIVNKEPAGKVIEKKRIQPSCIKSSLY